MGTWAPRSHLCVGSGSSWAGRNQGQIGLGIKTVTGDIGSDGGGAAWMSSSRGHMTVPRSPLLTFSAGLMHFSLASIVDFSEDTSPLSNSTVSQI